MAKAKPVVEEVIDLTIPEWDPFQGHTCETCTARRAAYTPEDSEINLETFTRLAGERDVQAIAEYAPTRAMIESDAALQRAYWSVKAVEARIVLKEQKAVRAARTARDVEVTALLAHHVIEEAKRIFNLPEAVAAREAASRNIRLEQEAMANLYNTPEILKEQATLMRGRGHDAQLRRVALRQEATSRERAMELLKRVIGDARWDHYTKHTWFCFMTPRGHKYRMGYGYSQQVLCFESLDSDYYGTECCYPSPTDPLTGKAMPFEDLMAGQFLALMSDEPGFLRTSFVSGHVPTWRANTSAGNVPLPTPALDYDVNPDGTSTRAIAVAK